MKEKMNEYRIKTIELWNSRTRKQKGLIISSILLFFLIVIGGSFLATRSTMVPLYNNLSVQEAGQIKEELDARGIQNEVSDSGTTIHVPEGMADSLIVDLAAQGIPNSGSIDYSFFSQNTSWGVTDNEFDIMRLDAMQTELGNLITGITGVEQANVMISLPQQQVFVSDAQEEGSASIVLTIAPGYQFEADQINGLYHLISKSVPNLSPDNIVIMDQNFNYYDLDQGNQFSSGDIYANQQEIKRDIERDIQRRVQQMLGTMIGGDKVVVSVTTDIDFTQEERIEQLVEPVDEEEIEGLPVSIETIHETYSGEGAFAGEVGAGEEDIMNYPAGEAGEGDYELIQESINYEFNRIQRDINESPYKIRDLGIQVAVDNRSHVLNDEGEPELLTAAEQAEVEEGIASILDSIISTSVDASYGEIDPTQNTSIVFQEFTGLDITQQPTTTGIPIWVYIIGGILLVAVIALIVLLVRKRRNQEDEFAYTEELEEQSNEVPEIEEPEATEGAIKKKQLEKMAKDKPDDFAKLLRSWISEE
ncbi:flagellar basal-body MS-ring/collar protein FliF [Amphibacillus cookii]|uniref:flagellar basal-body MS-ring/collar protein FliF n=1 Tax=Amphibacillus cookii TaxID=767787 RepID=UPI00195DA8E2|nr:flagellar basal-body MS-ring/collar protein FliF [Amphibacillus cookii]MBM7540568.1 flagellar M-ring protein FliF [Amphibacillus cookii]